MNIHRQNCIKTKQDLEKDIKVIIIKYKEIIFGLDSPIRTKCLEELKKQQVIDEKVYDQMLVDDTVRKLYGFQENVVANGNIIIDIKTGELRKLLTLVGKEKF